MSLSKVLLGLGYLLSVPPTLLFLRVAWRRWTGWFVALEAGCALLAAGWALEGERFPAWFNGGAGVGFAIAYRVIGKVRARRAVGG